MTAFALVGALALLMVFAMMESAATFLVRRNRKPHPSTGAALRERLLALSVPDCPARIEPVPGADLEVLVDPVPPAWRSEFDRIKLTTSYRARMVLDEERHEIRWFEMLRTSSFFVGFQGLVPRLSWSMAFWAGYIDVIWEGRAYGMDQGFPPRIRKARCFRVDTVAVKRAVRAAAGRAGWTFCPKLWWFQVRRRPDGTIPRGFLPTSTRYWSERQFWTAAYVLLYLATVAGIVVVSEGWPALLTWNGLRGVLGFSAFWWAVWAFIMGIFWVTTRP